MASNRIIVGLGMRLDGASLRAVQSRLQGFRRSMLSASQRMAQFGQAAQVAGENMARRISLPVLAAGGIVAKISGDFEKSLNILEAKTGASGEALGKLEAKARALGITTQFTAAQAAGGMIEFAKAGLDASQILDVIGPALNFAVAAQMELAEVAGLTANVLAQFGLEANQSARVADVLTKAADSATTNVGELGEALVFAGASSKAVGVPLEQTVTLLAAMANTGIKGSMAGTALSNAFVHIAKPTNDAKKALARLNIDISQFIDETGRTKQPFANLIRAFHESGAGLSDLVTIFGIRAGRALTGIVNDFSKVTDATNAMSKSQGNAAKQAAVVMKGLNGAVKTMISALEGLAIAIGKSGLTEFLTESIKGIAGLVRRMADLDPALLRIGTIIAGVAATMGPLLIVVGALSKAMAVLGTSSAAGWLGFGAPAIVAAAAIGFLFLVVQDIYYFLEGRPSLLGYLLADPDGRWDTTKENMLWFYDWIKFEIPKVLGEMWDIWWEKSPWGMGLTKLKELTRFMPGASGRGFIENVADLFRSDGTPKTPPGVGGGFPGGPAMAPRAFVGPQRGGAYQQVISPSIVLNLNAPTSGDPQDIVDLLREETAKIFGEVARQVQPPLAL